MKILHVYAKNLSIFEQALEGTGCRVNGSVDMTYMRRSFANFNARDTMGLVVFKNPMTKKTLKLIKAFDDLFVFSPMPIIVISDQATALYQSRQLRVKNSPLFLIDSLDNTISDIDLKHIMATLSCMSDEMYDMSEIEERHSRHKAAVSTLEVPTASLAEEVLSAYAALGGSKVNADKREEREWNAPPEEPRETQEEGERSAQEIWRQLAGIT